MAARSVPQLKFSVGDSAEWCWRSVITTAQSLVERSEQQRKRDLGDVGINVTWGETIRSVSAAPYVRRNSRTTIRSFA
jgi:hypothetical protein